MSLSTQSKVLALVPALAVIAASPSCQPAFTTSIPSRSLSIVITDENALGTPTSPLAISLSTPISFPVKVQALDENGKPDPTFNGYVRFSLSPGSVIAASGPNTTGRNVQLINGVADNVSVSVLGSYGDTAIWVEDLGYTPADPARMPPPQCANGKDDNNNGLIDYPVDPGCYAANDDSEDGGSYAGAVSQAIHFVFPRIADVRGVLNGGIATAFPNEQVQVNTQWLGTSGATPKGVVVVGIGAAGFFATDIGETRGFNSVYAYNYTAPALMYVCDRLISFGGTSADFYGFTEMNYPTWSLDEWDPTVRPCLVPEPITLDPSTISGLTGTMATLESGLVQVPQVGCSGLAQCCGGGCNGLRACCAQLSGTERAACTGVVDEQSFGACTESLVSYQLSKQCTGDAALFPASDAASGVQTCSDVVSADEPASCQTTLKQFQTAGYCGASTVHISQNFGPNLIPYTTAADGTVTIPTGAITADTTSCDYLGTGKLEFTDPREAACSTACTNNLECTEYSNFVANQQFTLVVESASGQKFNIFGNGSSAASFNPIDLKGKQIGAFSGNLMFFSGGSQFTITARCADDVVVDPSQLPLPSSQACVVSRAIPDTTTTN